MTQDVVSLVALRDKILRYRARHNLNQEEFAKICGLSKPTIGVIESGHFRVGRKGISRLTQAKILNIIEREERKDD